jgi:ATP-binding cassette subfamily B protein/subfamily B ATP-binding cassette protein MsbA
MMVLVTSFRLLVKRWADGSPSRKLLLQTAWSQKRRLFWVLVFGIFSAALEGATFALLAVALELLATNGSLEFGRLAPFGLGSIAGWSTGRQFIALIVVAVLCQVGKSVFQILNTQLSNLLGAQAAQEVQQTAFATILDMNFAHASRYKVGELTNFVVVPAEAVAQVLIQGLNLVTNWLTILAYVIVLCTISMPLFLAALLLFGFVVWIQKLVGRKIGTLSYTLAMQQADLSRKVVEGITGLRLVHSFARQQMVKGQVNLLQGRFIQTMRQLNLRLAMLGPLSESLLLIGLGGFLLVGFFLFKNDRTSLLPDLLTFIAVLNRLSSRISQFGIGWSTLKAYTSRVSVLNEILSTGPGNMLRQGGEVAPRVRLGIRFENVGLQYSGREEPALAGVTLDLPKGRSLALVGPSGSGKSSLSDLLVGLYEPTAGRITVDGTDLREIEIGSWRQLLGVVSQETLLFNASVRENLLFARPDASSEELEEAIHAADAAVFINELPQGLDTLIGERGFMLSGGQRQRLAIARALLRKPEILILDEATSALDTNAEQAVQATIDSLPAGGTRLIIAHRLSTIRNADQIAVLDRGRVVELGTHDELLDKRGLYWELWQKQTGSSQFPKDGDSKTKGMVAVG